MEPVGCFGPMTIIQLGTFFRSEDGIGIADAESVNVDSAADDAPLSVREDSIQQISSNLTPGCIWVSKEVITTQTL